MNDVGGDGTAVWYGVYDNATKTLQKDVSKLDDTTGTLIDNSQEAHSMVNGQPVFVYSSLTRASKAGFIAAMTANGITNPDNYVIPD
jgi:hypothetical protein